MEPLFLQSGQEVLVKLHPVVVFSILDAFLRRDTKSDNVVGTLLGNVTEGIVEITSAFRVQHAFDKSNAEVKFASDYHIKMMGLLRRVNPSEQAVGWFSTFPGGSGSCITTFTALVQNEYQTKLGCERPVHLVVDTSLADSKIGLRAFVTNDPFPSNPRRPMQVFQEVPVQLHSSAAEKIGLDLMVKNLQKTGEGASALTSDVDVLRGSIERLQEMLDDVCRYVDGVVEGKIEPDSSIGRMLADALSAIPHVKPDDFERIFGSGVQDLLMVVYLANLTQTQIGIAEKLASALPA